MKKRFGAGLVCASLLVFSTSALAWGDRERAGLWGVVGGVVLANALNNQAQAREYPPVAYSPPQRVYEYQTVYAPPPPRHVEATPYECNSGAAEAYERGRIARQRERQVRLEQEAYERGYRGSWGDWR